MSKINPNAVSLQQNRKNHIDYSKLLNPEQLEAVTTTEGAVLIVAGAGTGKTNTLIKRVMYLIGEKGVEPERILLLTFTNKAANEMISRAKNSLDERCTRIKGCTYHSFCAELLRKYSHLIGIRNNFVVYDTPDSADAFNLLKERLEISREEKFPSGKELVNILSASINKNRSIEYLLTNIFPEYEKHVEKVKLLIKEYKEYKVSKNAMDYDDLIVQMNRVLKENPNIAKKISDLYQYIMVDEYQDSNLIQLELLTLLRQFNNKNICVVGDDFQSIYGFRGSNFKNIMDFPNQFTPCKVITLFRNYRSNQEILDLSNAVMGGAKEKYDKNLIGQRHAGHRPYLVRVDSGMDEANIIYQTIRNYHNEGMAYNDMAVIVHGSNDSLMLEGLLMNNADGMIPYKKYGGIKFMERRFVKDIFAFLKLIINKSDEISWFRILQLLPGLGAAGAKKIISQISETGYDAIKSEKYAKKKYFEDMTDLHKFFTDIEKRDFHEQLDYIINTYYPELIKKGIMSKKNLSAYKELIAELDEHIEQAQVLIEIAKGFKTASSFVTTMTLEAPELKADGEFLTITTVHSVKGLEYKVVFVIDCIDGTFPWHKRPKAQTKEAYDEVIEEYEEERRVFYVAITRAKDDLYLFVPDITKTYGGIDKTDLSPFLSENSIYRDFCDIEDYREYKDDDYVEDDYSDLF